MPQKKKQTQAQQRAVNNRTRNKNRRALTATLRPNQPVRNTNTLRNTRQTVATPGNRMTVRQKGTYALAEVSNAPMQLSISPFGIHRFTSAYSALSMAFASHEQYFVHTASIEFIPELAVTEPGSIHLSPDYDPLDPMPADVLSMSSDVGYKSGAVSQRLVINIPNLRTPDGSFTRPMLYSSPNIIERLSDYALVNFRSTGVTAEGTIGRLVLHYDISFHLPQVPSFPTGALITTVHTLTYTAPAIPGTKSRLSQIDTDSDEGVLTCNTAIYSANIYSAILSAIDGLTLRSVAGRIIALGTRVFFRAIKSKFTSDGDNVTSTTVQDNVKIGEFNLSRAFGPLTEIILQGATLDTLGLTNVFALAL